MTLKSSPARTAAPNHVHMVHSVVAFATLPARAGGGDAAVVAATALGALVAFAIAVACAFTSVGKGVYPANSSDLFASNFVPAGAMLLSTLNLGRRGGRQTW